MKNFEIKLTKSDIKLILIKYIKDTHNLDVKDVFYNIETVYDGMYGDSKELTHIKCSGDL